MRALISKSEVGGRAVAPASKSYTIRGLMCAALATGESELAHPLLADDTEAALDVLGKVGIGVRRGEDAWRITGGEWQTSPTDLFCRESATTLRFMIALCSLVPGQSRLTAGKSLGPRPIRPLLGALRQLGVDCWYEDKTAVIVKGGGLRGGACELPGNISSQFVSALLLVAPLAAKSTAISLTTPLESKPYVAMTRECLGKFGITFEASADFRRFEVAPQPYRPCRYEVEGDWSSASYLLALGALAGEIEVRGLNPASLQGDRAILDILREMGADIAIEAGAIIVRKSKLRAVKADLTHCTDLLPTVAVLAAAAAGASEISGIARARIKESDRVAAVKAGLERMGAPVSEGTDRLVITGNRLAGATIDTRGDHRIAMAFALLGVVAGDTVIDDAGCVAKTYPGFWQTLKNTGGEVMLNE